MPHVDTIAASEPCALPVPSSVADRGESLGWPAVLALHVGPGVLIGAGFVLLAGRGTPANLALLLAMLLIGVPLELAGLLWLGRRQHRGRLVDELPADQHHLPQRQAVVLIPLLFIWSLAAYAALAPAAELLRQSLFGWWPNWLRLDRLAGDLAATDGAMVWTILLLSIVLNLLGPWVEELYFRGYLLPQMGRPGRWVPVLNCALFSLYHVWLPWEFFSRLAALLPAIYVVWWKRDVRVSIWVHVLLNSVGSVALLVLVLGQPARI